MRSVITLFALAMLSTLTAAAGIPEWQVSEAGVRYVSGGVGQEERAGMEARYGHAALRVTNVVQGSGAYLSGGVISVTDSSGVEILRAKSDGPWFFIDLPPGSYDLQSRVGEATQTRRVQVSGVGQRREKFAWVKPGPDPVYPTVPRQKPLPPWMTGKPAESPRQPVTGPARQPARLPQAPPAAPERERERPPEPPPPLDPDADPYFCPPGSEFDPACL